MRNWRAWVSTACLGTAVMLLTGAGCIITIEPDAGSGGGGSDTGDGGAQTITIRVVNATSTGLDPQIYISSEPVTADELFVDGNKFTSFGFLKLGALDGFSSDEFEVNCADARLLGTRGGAFGDDPLNNPDGNGTQIVLSQDVSVFCGGTVVFTYSRSGDGFATSFQVNP